ncbi:hypothetical protein G6F66_014482 [Rhizopus arrhizus]|nr:hypothetical protein G6F66_014482 [Rhizopus arrhizus]
MPRRLPLTSTSRVGAADGRAAHRGDVLQDVGHRAEALAFDLDAGQRQHRLGGFHIDLADARTGDLDAIQIGRRGAAGILGERRHGGQSCGRHQGVGNRLAQHGT